MTRSATIASSSWSRSTRWARSARTWPRSRPGTRIDFEGPTGAFTLGAAPAPAYLFVAGGTGISPLRAMLRHLIATDAGVAAVGALQRARARTSSPSATSSNAWRAAA